MAAIDEAMTLLSYGWHILKIEYYEAEDGSFFLRDPLEHQSRKIIEPILEDEDVFRDGLPYPKIRETVYTLRTLGVPVTDEGALAIERRPLLKKRIVGRFVRNEREVMRQLIGAQA